MQSLVRIFYNYPLISAIISWMIAQLIKAITDLVKNHRFSFLILTSSGGMPSSHSALVVSLATAVGLSQGFDSAVFAAAASLAFIVMYDASGVRRAAGEQAKILNRILDDIEGGIKDEFPKRLKELLGHTPLQVYAGAALGMAVAIAGYFIVFA